MMPTLATAASVTAEVAWSENNRTAARPAACAASTMRLIRRNDRRLGRPWSQPPCHVRTAAPVGLNNERGRQPGAQTDRTARARRLPRAPSCAVRPDGDADAVAGVVDERPVLRRLVDDAAAGGQRCGEPLLGACSRATETSTCIACRSGLAASSSCIHTVEPCPSGSTPLSSRHGRVAEHGTPEAEVDLVGLRGDGQLDLLDVLRLGRRVRRIRATAEIARARSA